MTKINAQLHGIHTSFKAEVHKSNVPGRHGNWILYSGT
jgi:hypothetical protein